MAALADHPLAADISARMTSWAPVRPSPEDNGFIPLPPSVWGESINVSTGAGVVNIAFDSATGGLSALTLPGGGGGALADASHRMAVLVYRQYNDTDYAAVENCPACYVHPGAAAAAAPPSASTAALLVGLWAAAGTAPTKFLAQVQFPFSLVAEAGAPADAWIGYTVTPVGELEIDVQLFDKTPTRLGEAIFLEWNTLMPAVPNGRWHVQKIATWVDPLDVFVNGAHRQHSVSGGVAFFDPALLPAIGSPAVFIDTIDAPVICPATAAEPYSGLPISVQPLTGPVTGFASMLFANSWAMNYPLWSIDADFRFRFVVRTQ